MNAPYGCYELGGIEGLREKFPIVLGVDKVDAIIPFNSEIKFNCIIRDMNPKERNPKKEEDNLCIFLKGAPERVLARCCNVLIDGKLVPKDEHCDKEIEAANDRFGMNGERVLAFARKYLDPAIFTKDPAYPFDVKKWKTW